MANWKLDTIAFESYGVSVSAATGLLNAPGVVVPNQNWLDEYGIEFNPDTSLYKSKSREIRLNCFIIAGNYSDFVTKVNTFKNAIKGTKRTLSCDYAPDTEVYLKKEIRISRHTGWNENKQVGIFTLFLTVEGEDDAYSLDILRLYSYNTVATVLTKNLKIHKTLQNQMWAQCTFETNTPIDFQYFDFIQINSNGVNDDRFMLNTLPTFKKLSTNKYVYSIRFEHQTSWLNRSQFTFEGESDFDYFGNADEILDLIITNHNRSTYGKFSKGSVVATTRKNWKFTGQNCYEVLRRICQEYELEYRFEFVDFQYDIHIEQKVGIDRAVTLQYGKGNGLYELSRGSIAKDFTTVLFAYGSQKNLPPIYRDGLRRLSFTGNPLSNNTDTYNVIERTKIYEDIYPHFSGTVKSYYQKLPDDPTYTLTEKEVFPQGIFKITDTSLADATYGFNINDFLMDGLTAKVSMKTGALAGYQFEIFEYNHETNEIFIIPFKDERGEMFPNDVLTISGESTVGAGDGDEYTLVDIKQPDLYVTDAEAELKAAAQDYLNEISQPRVPYNVKTDPIYIAAYGVAFEVGDKIDLVDTDYGENGKRRIASLVYDVYQRYYTLELSDIYEIPKLQRTEYRLSIIEDYIKANRKNTVETSRESEETTNELRNRILDPIDDKVRTDKIVRDESIDPRMLSYDSGAPQFSLQNALVECNVGGNEDVVKIGAGILTMHNFKENTKDRYQINKLRSAGIDYNPTRIWIIQETTFTLPLKTGYWMYAKLNMSAGSTECIIEVVQEHVEIKKNIQDGFLKYKLGHISDAGSPRTASMLWGNVKAPSLVNDYRPRAAKTTLVEGNNTVTFKKAFEVGLNYVLWVFTYDDNWYRVGNRIIDGSETETGFIIYVPKACNLRYIAAIEN